VSKFFNGNPSLGTVSGGIEHFTGKAGAKRWHAIGEVIGRSWDDVLAAIDDIVTTPEVDSKLSDKAADELAEEREEREEDEPDEDTGTEDAVEEQSPEQSAEDDAEAEGEDTDDEVDRATGDNVVLGSNKDFWLQVGIDPIRIMTSSGTFYTLRCYLDDQPIFLGRNGRISVFTSERALARYLADEHDHDLADLATYDDIRTAATDGSLRVDVSDENVYVLSGISDDIADGPDAIDHDQLELAVELLRDVSDYAEDKTVEETLAATTPLGKFVGHVLDPDKVKAPAAPYADAVEQWETLERFVESRLRPE
jgi:hypothetical protein